MTRIAVIGAGAWGCALAIQGARAGLAVTLVTRDSAHAGVHVAKTSCQTGVALATEVNHPSDAVLLAVPTQQLRAALTRLRATRDLAGKPTPLLLCCKGIEAGTHKLPLEVAAELWPDRPAAVLTGPNFAGEVAAGLPAAALVASDPAYQAFRTWTQDALATPTFRLYGSNDPVGAQLGGAAKNVIAIAAGAVIGAGYGENARAALVTRGLAELSRLIVAQGGRAETAAGLSGLGDLMLTCTGAASRNFTYGLALGRGERTDTGATVEGVATAPALVARATGVDLPICQAVDDLLAERISMGDALVRLMSRPRRNEW